MIQRFISWLSSLFLYVIMDPADNSVTINKWLWKDMGGFSLNSAKVFMFQVKQTGEFGFELNPKIEQETQIAEIQYNTKYKCIGFETLNPTVNWILYKYNLPVVRVKMAVSRRRLPDGRKYYAILKPTSNGKSTRKIQEA